MDALLHALTDILAGLLRMFLFVPLLEIASMM
jgi:hypothetical protein